MQFFFIFLFGFLIIPIILMIAGIYEEKVINKYDGYKLKLIVDDDTEYYVVQELVYGDSPIVRYKSFDMTEAVVELQKFRKKWRLENNKGKEIFIL